MSKSYDLPHENDSIGCRRKHELAIIGWGEKNGEALHLVRIACAGGRAVQFVHDMPEASVPKLHVNAPIDAAMRRKHPREPCP